MSPPVETPASTTKQREQNIEEQKKDSIVDVAKDLKNFGIAQSAITKVIQDYPVAYIKEKLAVAQGLVAARSCLVSQNPAGWLRCAIEEDYTLPNTSERHRWRLVREKKEARQAQAKSREQHTPEEKSQPAQNVATTPYQCPQNVVTPEKQEAEKTEQSPVRRDQRENQMTWDKALEQLKIDLPQEEVKGLSLPERQRRKGSELSGDP